jgi:hypothetical protein
VTSFVAVRLVVRRGVAKAQRFGSGKAFGQPGQGAVVVRERS